MDRSIFHTLIQLSLLLSIVNIAQGRDLVPNGRSPESITVADCRVSLLRRAVLASEQSGVLDDISVQDGDLVDSGQLVAQIRDRLAKAATETAAVKANNDVELRYAEKLSELARLEYAGALQLNDKISGAAYSEFRVRNLRVAAQRALLQVEQATHQLEMARIEHKQTKIALDSYRVQTPFAGVVLRVHKVIGEAVQSGEAIAEIGDPDVLRVEGMLPLSAAWQIQRGQSVDVWIKIPNLDLEVERHSFPGEIVFVDTEVQQVTQQVRVWARVRNKDKLLRAGLTANMRIDLMSSVTQETDAAIQQVSFGDDVEILRSVKSPR